MIKEINKLYFDQKVIPRAKNYYNKVSALPKNIQIRSKHTENTMCFRHHTCDILFLLSMNFLCVSVLLTCLVDAQNYHYSKGWAAGKRSFLAERMSHVLKRFDNGPDTILRVSKSLKKSQNMPNEMLDISEVLQRSQNVPKRILGMSKAQQGPDTLHTRILGMTNSLKRSENVLELLDMSKILKRAEEVPEAIQEMSKVLARSDDVPKRILDMSKVHRGSEIMPDNILEMPKVPKRLEIVPDEILALTENDMSITWKRSHNLPDTLPQDSTDFDQLGQKLSRRNFGAHHAAVSLQGAWDDGPGSGYRGSSLKGEGRRKDDKKHRCGFKKDMEELLAEIFEIEMSRVYECLAENAHNKAMFSSLNDQDRNIPLHNNARHHIWEWMEGENLGIMQAFRGLIISMFITLIMDKMERDPVGVLKMASVANTKHGDIMETLLAYCKV